MWNLRPIRMLLKAEEVVQDLGIVAAMALANVCSALKRGA
jgi:hypothetical protein